MVSTFSLGWVIEAEGLISHDVACHCIGARTGTTANADKLAQSAASFVKFCVAQIAKERRVPVNVYQRAMSNVAGAQGQEAAWENFAAY